MTKSFHYPQVDLNNVTAIAVWYETHDIPQRYNAAIVFASVLVACLGAHSTLVILGKRTGNDGIKNTMLLIWSAMTMSCVGIWGMHFIGMNFRLEPVPGMNWYVAFSPGFTVFSLIVPFISLVLAFVFVDYYTLRIWRIVVSGILTGCIVGLMHYSASMKSNFNVSYAPAQTIISILLACFCAIIALTLFFRLRAQWQDSWQRRLFCSIILAIGVSGMHYTGSSGTSYRIKSSQIENLERLKNDGHGNLTVVIIVAVMCFVIFVVSTFISVSDVITARETRKRARKIVLASASFDHLGRLLVQADGSLPFVTLEEKTLRHSEVLDALDSRSEIFQWLFSISWAWNIVIPFLNVISDRVGKTQKSTSSSISLEHAACEEGVPCNHPWYIRLARRLHIDIASRKARQEEKKAQMASIAANATSFNAGIAHNTRSIALLDFRDRVVDAARRLSDQLELSLEEVGVFYDHILSTGTKKHLGPKATLARHQRQLFGMREKRGLGTTLSHSNDDDDEEASISTSRVPSIFAEDDDNDDELEEGVSMFLVREVSAAQQMIFAKRGYRFTETRFLTNVLADRHGVGKMRMDELLDGLKLYAKRGTRPVVQPGGVYAGLFGVRPSMTARQGGLDVLVYNFARHQIPAFRLPDVVTMTNEMRTFLRLLDQMPVDQALKICERESIRTAERNKAIARLLLDQAQQQKLQQSEVFSLRRSSEALSAAISQSDSLGGTTVLGDLTKDSNWSNEENLRQVLDLQTQEASLQAFQIALYTALEALMQSVRVFPRLMSTARLSADVLEVPSSLDDAKPPAYVILVQAVLPIDKATNARSSASMLSGLVGQNNGIGESSNSSNNAFKPTLGSLVMPTETPQNGTPFVFTPYTLFTKTQTMLLRGKTAQKFTLEVQQALGDRYNVDLLDSTMFVEENEKDKKFSEDEIEVAYLSRNKSLSIKNDNEGIADGDEKENAENGQDSSKGWMGRLLNGGKNSNIASRKQSLVDDIPNDKIIIIEDNSSIHQSEKPTRLPLSPVAGGLVTSSTLNDLNDLQNNQIGSLGIRRFTGTGTNGEIQNNEIDQSKFARPAEDIELQQTSSSTPPLKRPSYPPSAARYYKRQGSMNSLVREESIRSRISRQSSDSFGNGNGIDESQITSTSMIKSNSMQQSNSNRSRGRSHTIGVTGNRPIGLSNPEITVSDSRQAIQEINGNTLISKISFVNALGIPKRPQTAHSIGGGIGRPRSASHTGRQSSESAHEVQNHLRVHKNNISNSANQRGSPHTLNDLDYTPINVDHDSIQARQRLDNWQLRQLRDLERFQPNLLMGVLPSEY